MLAGVAAAGYGDIGPAHFNILQHPTPDGLRPTEVAARAQMTKQAANRLIRHLERGGYLTLEPDPRDQRARIIRLTDRGWDVIAAIRGIVEDVEAEWSQRLGRRRFETLRGMLAELGEPYG
jgi:DNA-binding MarR family transcriptional regulator